MQFQVRYFDTRSRTAAQEVMSAASEAELRQRWPAGGDRVLLSVERHAWRHGKGQRLDVAWWCRELKALLAAGMTVVEAIDTLRAQSSGTVREPLYAQLTQSLSKGWPLSRAMEATGLFPAVLLAGIRASERTSTLVSTLDDYLRYEQLLQDLKRKAVSAAIYPAVVLTLGMAVTLFLLMYVMPRFARMYSELEASTTGTTSWLLKFSLAISQHSISFGLGLLLLGCGVYWTVRSGRLMAWVQALVRRVPLLEREWDHLRMAKLYRSMSLLFKGGYPLDECLVICQRIGLGPRVDSGLQATHRSLVQGRSVGRALSDAGLADVVTYRLLAVGERTGNFAEILQTVSERHAELFSNFVERTSKLLEPMLLLIVALVVGGVVVLMYMPVFDIATGLQR